MGETPHIIINKVTIRHMYKNPFFLLGLVGLIVVAGFVFLSGGYDAGDDVLNVPEVADEVAAPFLVGDNAIYISNQGADDFITVGLTQLAQDGYVVVHEDNGGAPGAILGSSELLAGGRTDNVRVALIRETIEGETLYGMLHFDNGDNTFNAALDTPVVDEGENITLMIFQIGGEESISNNDEQIIIFSAPGNSGDDLTNLTLVNHIISMESSGFNPTSITIRRGDSVTWVNNDTKGHRPASTLHPTHTDLPGFDSLSSVSPGDSYILIFTQVGSWGFHDHLKPGDGGTIHVTE